MNQKRASLCIYLAMGMGLMTACGSEIAEDGSDVVLEIMAHAEPAYAADTIQELYEYSDFVAEIQVTGTEGQLSEGGGVIFTFFEADVVTLYKGTYNGERFYTDGGYMNLGEYLEGVPNPGIYDAYSEEERQNGVVYMNYMEAHVPEVGETLMIFGKCFEEEGVIAVSSIGQSLFVCNGDAVTIDFEGAFVSDLQEDLQNNFQARIEEMDGVRTAICTKDAFTAVLS